MPFSTGHLKVHTNTIKTYRRPQQYIYLHCQLGCKTPGHALLVSMCIFMLPMLGQAADVQLATTPPTNPINFAHPPRMTLNHAFLLLPLLNNVLPAMVLLYMVVSSNMKYPSSDSSVHVYLCPSGLGRREVKLVVVFLLLLSGDIETNPGPVG